MSELRETKTLLPFSSPTTVLISGGTMCGKTTLTYEIMKPAKGMFKTPPQKIVLAYGEYQPMFSEMETSVTGLNLHQGLPTRDDFDKWSSDGEPVLLVIDDLINQVTKNEDSLFLFCVAAHHKNITVMLLTQNLYMPGKYARTILLNCQYVILFRNIRDARQIMTFGSQVFPGRVDFFKSAYDLATSKPYGYILIDMSSSSEASVEEKYRLRSNILPGQDTIVYVLKG